MLTEQQLAAMNGQIRAYESNEYERQLAWDFRQKRKRKPRPQRERSFWRTDHWSLTKAWWTWWRGYSQRVLRRRRTPRLRPVPWQHGCCDYSPVTLTTVPCNRGV